MSLLCDAGSEIRLEGRGKIRATITNRMGKKKVYYSSRRRYLSVADAHRAVVGWEEHRRRDAVHAFARRYGHSMFSFFLV